VLSIGPKVCGTKPGQGRYNLMEIEIYSTTSFEWEVNLAVPCKILQYVKEPYRYERDIS
jgi:hypothetical protein